MHLPQELIDCIIDVLGSFEGASDPERRQALKACSLTSSSFLASSRKYLFANIRLEEEECFQDDTHDFGTSSGLGRILDVLVNDDKTTLSHRTPPLASHMRSLSINLSQARAYQNLTIYSSSGTMDTNRPSTLAAILEILTASSSITLFSLKFPSFVFYEWQYVDAQLKAGIESFCRSPSVTTLQFQTILGLPTTLITGCPNLKALYLNSVYTGTMPDHSLEQVPGNPFPHLESLVLKLNDNGSGNVLKHLFLSHSNASSLPKLQDIQISLDPYFGHLSAQELEVLKGAPSLKTIRLEVDCPIYRFAVRFAGDLDLSLLSSLRSLILDINLWDHPLDNMASTSLARSSTCSIKYIVISMRWRVRNSGDLEIVASRSHDDWREFDEVITSSRFPCLTRLSLRLYVAYDHPSTPSFDHVSTKLSSGIRGRLPAASTSASFSFVIDIQRISADIGSFMVPA
ncbi:hypothetical protein M413DRAFT_450036, partial [Hebeloma cylindrosporum]